MNLVCVLSVSLTFHNITLLQGYDDVCLISWEPALALAAALSSGCLPWSNASQNVINRSSNTAFCCLSASLQSPFQICFFLPGRTSAINESLLSYECWKKEYGGELEKMVHLHDVSVGLNIRASAVHHCAGRAVSWWGK